MTAPSARRRPAHPSGRTVATVALRGPAAAPTPSAKVTVAVAAGTTSRIATQSVSPVRPSKGLAANGGGAAERSLVRVCRTLSLPVLRRLDALPMFDNPTAPPDWQEMDRRVAAGVNDGRVNDFYGERGRRARPRPCGPRDPPGHPTRGQSLARSAGPCQWRPTRSAVPGVGWWVLRHR